MDVKLFRYSIATLCGLFVSTYAFSQSATDIEKAQQQNNQIIRQFQQQQKAQSEQRENQQPHIQLDLNNKLKRQSQIEDPNALCFAMAKIDVQGVSLLSPKKVKQLTQPYVNECLSLNKINGLIKSITLSYVDLGYVTSRAYIPKQNLAKGTLHLIVIEGIVESMDKTKASTINIKTAFTNLQNKPLNLHDIEQGIEQINRLSSNKAHMNLVPGKAIGATIIQLNNTLSNPWQSQISIDNSG